MEARGVSAVRLDTDIHGARCLAQFAVRDDRAGVRLRVGEQQLEGDQVTAILYRHLHLHEAEHVEQPEARELASSELRAALEGGLLAIDCHWMNHPYANRLARNKPLQLALASRLGFSLPETSITDDPERIRGLYRSWRGEMVAKLVGGQVIASTPDDQYVVYTTPVTERDLDSAEALAACPAIYQRRVEKAFDLRVTVVGERVFACQIDSTADLEGSVDWRRAGVDSLPVRECSVDEGLAGKCLMLMRSLNLELAGLDFIVTPAGEAVFLEVNAAGQWLWVQQATGMPIAQAIAERLIAGSSESRSFTTPSAPTPA